MLVVGAYLRKRDFAPQGIATLAKSFEKMGNVMKSISVPYFMRKSILVKNCVALNEKDYLKCAAYFETEQIRFTGKGNNQEIRERYVMSFLRTHADNYDCILDFGCGSYNIQRIRNAQKLKKKYIGIDVDEKVQEKLEDVTVFKDLDELTSNYQSLQRPAVLLCTEVIEHLTTQEAHEEIGRIPMTLHNQVEAIIITTPNKTFNAAYLLEESELRHADHVVEYDEKGFRAFVDHFVTSISDSTQTYQVKSVDGLGDTFNNAPCIWGAIISKVAQ
jgi:2-polyprenyl-3-methyl-5-hydroxy-6-metoxy-1,4-benzoquinol methylase